MHNYSTSRDCVSVLSWQSFLEFHTRDCRFFIKRHNDLLERRLESRSVSSAPVIPSFSSPVPCPPAVEWIGHWLWVRSVPFLAETLHPSLLCNGRSKEGFMFWSMSLLQCRFSLSPTSWSEGDVES